MNRTILIVICDFLLVSLLAFSTVDINKAIEGGIEGQARVELPVEPPQPGNDLAEVMRLALDDERRQREQLLAELARSRAAAGQAQALSAEREQQVQSYQTQLQSREREAAGLQQQQAALQQRFTAARSDIEALSRELEMQRQEASASREKIATMEAELKKRAQESVVLQEQIGQLAESNVVVQAEKQRLSTQLQVAEVERRHATEQVVAMREQVKVEREERVRLSDNIQTLASQSGQLVQEIRENRALTANALFNELSTNRVQARFAAYRPALFLSTKERETETVLVSDGTNLFALCHVDETPLTLANPATDWERLTGGLSRGGRMIPIQSLAFHARDPRVVMIPLSSSEADQLGAKVYPVSSDPFKFQDAVLVGAKEGYYGECKFEIDLGTPDYVKLDRSFLRGLVGKFNPSRGDLVFSKTGELLGVMANSTYCLQITSFKTRASLPFGPDLLSQRTGGTLSALYLVVFGMPSRLQ